MTDTLLDLSGKLPQNKEQSLREVAIIASQLGISFFVVGAFARDLILEGIHNIKTQRATEDIDFGIRVESWDQFMELKSALLQTGRFQTHPAKQQRLFYEEDSIIDIVPFGG